MKKYWLVFSLLSCLFIGFTVSFDQPVAFEVPKGWPIPTYNFKEHPLTENGIQLGRRLFYDPVLSLDSTISCANCHTSFYAFTHVDHSISHGIGGRQGKRNSSALMNLAWSKQLMWDGAISHLEVQALAPMANADEMGETLEGVLAKLNAHPDYRGRFYRAFGDSAIGTQNLLNALTQFMLTLVSNNSKYDSVMRKEAGVQFTTAEKHGYRIYKKNCASCHTEPLFTNNEFRKNGMQVYRSLNDMGRMTITHRSEDSLLFKVPTLRNLEFTFPYMHDGRFRRFSQFINHYSEGIQTGPTLSKELKGPLHFTQKEKDELTAFLLTLSDRWFITNPLHAFPGE